jgi:hypothetical protein
MPLLTKYISCRKALTPHGLMLKLRNFSFESVMQEHSTRKEKEFLPFNGKCEVTISTE